MNFLIGNIDPVQNDPQDVNLPDGNPQIDTPPIQTENKKTNWYLYAVLGIVALGLIMGNKK